LSAYLDGELEPLERAAVEHELEVSEESRRLLAELATLDELARGLPVAAPEGYFEALPGRVRARLAAGRTRRRSLPAWAWAAAAVLAVAAVAPLTLGRLEDAAPPPAAVPPVTLLDEAQAPHESLEAAAATAEDTVGDSPMVEPQRQRHAAEPPPPTPLAPGAGPAGGAAPEQSRAEGEAPREPSRSLERLSPDSAAPTLAPATPAPDRTDVVRDGPPEPGPTPAAAAVGSGTAGVVAAAEEAAVGAEGEVRGPSARPQAVASGTAKRHASNVAVGADAERFTGFAARRPRSADEARRLREDWRGFVLLYPESALADEARVRTIEAGLEAFRLGEDEGDRVVARRDAEAYLDSDGASQRSRVEALLAALER
jgi:hypothetical protein